jgi:hypothetical protein
LLELDPEWLLPPGFEPEWLLLLELDPEELLPLESEPELLLLAELEPELLDPEGGLQGGFVGPALKAGDVPIKETIQSETKKE